MQLQDFRNSLEADAPPAGLSPAMQALWWDAKQAWGKAHDCAQQDEGRDAAWVHAYLHRKEGDRGNALYWYGRARRPACEGSLPEEWTEIATALLPAVSASR
jgi:hypothetical protein